MRGGSAPALPTGGAGRRPFSSSFCKMNASTGVRTQAESFTAGMSGRCGLRNAHQDGRCGERSWPRAISRPHRSTGGSFPHRPAAAALCPAASSDRRSARSRGTAGSRRFCREPRPDRVCRLSEWRRSAAGRDRTFAPVHDRPRNSSARIFCARASMAAAVAPARSRGKARENQTVAHAPSRISIPRIILCYPRPSSRRRRILILEEHDAKLMALLLAAACCAQAGAAIRCGGLRRYLRRSDRGHRGREAGRAGRAARAGAARGRHAHRRPGPDRYGPPGERHRRSLARILRASRQTLRRADLVAVRAQRRRADPERLAERSRRPGDASISGSPPPTNAAGRIVRLRTTSGDEFEASVFHRQQLRRRPDESRRRLVRGRPRLAFALRRVSGGQAGLPAGQPSTPRGRSGARRATESCSRTSCRRRRSRTPERAAASSSRTVSASVSPEIRRTVCRFRAPKATTRRDSNWRARTSKALGDSARLADFMGISLLPNDKTDINSGGAVSTNLPGASWEYPEASYERRQRDLARASDVGAGAALFPRQRSGRPASASARR